MPDQLVELGSGGRPWGRTFAGFSQDKLSGQIEIAEGPRSFVVAFAAGTVVGARSPLATDAAVRIARLANLISPSQVSSFVHAHGTQPKDDDIDLLIAHAKLNPDQANDLRRKVIAHRAARTFSVEAAGDVKVEPVTIEVIPGCVLDPRAIIYQGARHNLTERRLTGELARMGTWFRIKPGIDPMPYGFGENERALLERLQTGGSLEELESCAPGIDVRMVRGALYALCATDACDIRPTAPFAALTAAPVPTLDQIAAEMPVQIVDVVAPRPEVVDLPTPRGEQAVAPKSRVEADDLLAPKGRDTVVDSSRVDLVGMIVDGRYVIDRKIGDGAMGTVYLSHHTKLDRLFAVKVLHRRLLASDKSRRRFDREAEQTSRLSHHNVVRVVDVGTVEGLPYLAMEFAEGISLETLLVDAPLAQKRAFQLLRQLCAGLQHAHDASLVHRDLKPANVIVDSSGDEEILRIVDFGIAILNEPDGTDRLTTRGVVLGTPDYMAPELALGNAIDHRLDLYALGVIAYEMFTGVKPFSGDGVDVALANLNQPVPPIAERAPKAVVDPLVEALIGKLLEKQPGDRPASAHAVRKLIDLIETDREAAARALGVKDLVETPTVEMVPLVGAQTLEMPPLVVAKPVAEPVDDRAPVKTRAMWKLERGASAPIPVMAAEEMIAPPMSAPIARPSDAVPRVRDDYATEEIRPVRPTGLYIGIAIAVGLIVFVIILVTRPLSKKTDDKLAPAPVAAGSAPEPVKPAPPPKPAEEAKPDTSAQGIVKLHRAVGVELAALERMLGRGLTADLLRRYRVINLVAAQTPPRRAAAHQVLTQLQREIAILRDAGK